MQSQAANTKQTWLIIFGSLAFSVLIYGLLAFLIQNSQSPRVVSPNLPTLRIVVTGLALASLLAAMAWLHLATAGKMGDSDAPILTPGEFQTQSIIAMALTEACTLMGFLLFFLGNTLQEFAPSIVASLLVYLGYILPKGLRYWAAWEDSQKPKPPSAFD